ncbi:MAG: recombinase family protein [Rhodobacter sp.]|nr:recombinase family protein [Rhodobacter sp.]
MPVGYARVSTMDRDPALQTDALLVAGCGRIFTEKASGAHRDRPGLRAALDFLREGGTLVVWKLSRLARSIAQVIRTAAGLERRDIALRVLSRNIDTGTPEGRLFFHVTAAFDGFQRELVVENSRAGLKAANGRGRRGGRPRAMDERTLRHAEAMPRPCPGTPGTTPSPGTAIDRPGIGRTAFYRYFPPERIRQLRKERADGVHP